MVFATTAIMSFLVSLQADSQICSSEIIIICQPVRLDAVFSVVLQGLLRDRQLVLTKDTAKQSV